MDLASLWCLDRSVAYLNHGSFGACPSEVLEAQTALRGKWNGSPWISCVEALPSRLDAARRALAAFLDTDPLDLVFVQNATAGVNAVLRSLDFGPDDELLVTSHTYAACRKTVDYVATRTGARVVVATVPYPCGDEEEIVAAILSSASPRTRLALLDHVTSPTALILPIARLVGELHARGIDTLVDGAHAPGMIPLDLPKIGAAYYTGNAHKWLCAPKGAAFLHVRRDRQAPLHPTVISHGYGAGFQAEFDWTGTFDPSPWLCIPVALRFIAGLIPGGWPAVMSANRALTLQARELLLQCARTPAPCPESMIGSMASIPLPRAAAGAPGAGARLPGSACLVSGSRRRDLAVPSSHPAAAHLGTAL